MTPTVIRRLKIFVNVYQKLPKYVINPLYNTKRYNNSKLSITYL